MRKILAAVLLLAILLCGCSIFPRLPVPVGLQEGKDISHMSDSELYDALIRKYYVNLSHADIPNMSNVQIAAAVCLALDMEVNEGGLCQFYFNCPYFLHDLPACLELLGAVETRRSFEQFIADNQIDLNDQHRDISIQAYLELYEKYPWEDFDTPYCDGEVYRCLIAFARLHQKELF